MTSKLIKEVFVNDYESFWGLVRGKLLSTRGLIFLFVLNIFNKINMEKSKYVLFALQYKTPNKHSLLTQRKWN